jgi:hypothetical protein
MSPDGPASPHRSPALLLAAWLALAVALPSAGCDCAGTPPPATCASAADCPAGQRCVDRACVDAPDTDAGPETDAGPPPVDAGRDAGPPCPSMTLCGTPPACCAEGDECIEDRCLPACASAVRCGADRETCCDAGQVCVSAACVDPGVPCTDSFDCPIGDFCEPTLGRCLRQFDPVTCRTEPVFGDFTPVLEWAASTATLEPTCMHAISAPVVVDLTGDGAPEVVANFACDSAWEDGVLRAYTGTGDPLWTAGGAELRIHGRIGIAGADLDGDGSAEIIAIGRPVSGNARVMAFSSTGTLLWRSTQADGTTPYFVTLGNGAPSVSDLDGDGTPEILVGAVALGADGRLLWESDTASREGTNSGYIGGIPVVADLDADGIPEVITGRRAYRRDGTPFWVASVPDGYPAIAQFDGDPQPEVVLVASGVVYILDGLSGAVQWMQPLPFTPGRTAGRGGPPTIADFDGDGLPEIGVAGASAYAVFDPDGPAPVLWWSPTEDVSSNATGSSVFDFEGDGVAEVVYADECYVRVYRGTDGAVQLRIPNSSATIHEYPLVADVDADGRSEIIVVANDRDASVRTQCTAADASWTGARRGLFVYGDASNQWVRTRRVWNQHAYHVTNVLTPGGRIPAVEANNWQTPGLNNYRQNVQGEGVYNAPDLVVLALEVRLDNCPTSATLRARVANEGSLGAPAGIPVSFRTGTPAAPGALLGVVSTTVALLPGASTVVELRDVPLMGEPPYAFVAIVDDDGTGSGVVAECREDDNAAGIGDLSCAILF